MPGHNRSRLFSSKGRLIVLGLAALLVAAGLYAFKKNYTPGPLSSVHAGGEMLGGYSSHAEFEKECKHCHAPIHCLAADRCQECHYEIAKQRSESVGLHGALPGTARCQTCHTEHKGRDAVISEVALANIDHGELTGFSLIQHAGKSEHSPAACDDCHLGTGFAADQVDCTSCHADDDQHFVEQHRNEYGDDCTGCHDGRDRMANFDHNLFYALDGGHAGVECAGCHLEKVFAGTARDCVACHPEPEMHVGIFGPRCERCHTATAWAPAQLAEHDFIAQLGRAEPISCEHCHVDTYVDYPCFSCHELDEMATVHRQWEIGEVEDCVACHPTGRNSEIKHLGGVVPGVPAGSPGGRDPDPAPGPGDEPDPGSNLPAGQGDDTHARAGEQASSLDDSARLAMRKEDPPGPNLVSGGSDQSEPLQVNSNARQEK